MLSNLQLVLFFDYLIIESLKEVLIRLFVMGNIVVYHIIIIPNALNKMVNYLKLKVAKV